MDVCVLRFVNYMLKFHVRKVQSYKVLPTSISVQQTLLIVDGYMQVVEAVAQWRDNTSYIKNEKSCGYHTDLVQHQEYIIKGGRVSNSVYPCANTLRIIKFPTCNQANVKPTSYTRWLYTGGLDYWHLMRSEVYYRLQSFTTLIIGNAFAHRYTEFDTLPSFILYSCQHPEHIIILTYLVLCTISITDIAGQNSASSSQN